MEPKLENVFTISGIPKFTFVEPREYNYLKIALRSPGRGVVIEGPSGIGKTTAVENALLSLNMSEKVTKLSARRASDVELIEGLPNLGPIGVVVVDDFHKLSDQARSNLADYMKTLADEGDESVKIIILGINRAGESLIRFASDLVNRVDIIPFEANPDEKVEELLLKGEDALGISINVKDEIVSEAKGSFYLAQMLAFEVCMQAAVTERPNEPLNLEESFPSVRSRVWERLGASFRERCEEFCRGTRLRKEGRAPYLHILRWLSQCDDWTLSLRDAIRQHTELRGSVGQVFEKGYLEELIAASEDLRAVIHYDKESSQLTVDDPQFLFYIRNIPWQTLAKKLGFEAIDIGSRYDFALSFAGTDRELAERLFFALEDRELEVFYDKNEQHRILAQDVEEYLAPIYQSEASFVVALLGPDYPKRIWTRIEAAAFRQRMGDGAVIPVWFTTAPPGTFDETTRLGGIQYDPSQDMDAQVEEIARVLTRKLRD